MAASLLLDGGVGKAFIFHSFVPYSPMCLPGIGRHINYLGDILIATGWTLPCGFSSLIVRRSSRSPLASSSPRDSPCLHEQPWTHSMFFIPFLMHREYRDEHRMKKKYGPTYEEYCRIAKYRIFPFIY